MVTIIVNCCCTRVLLYAKKLKETETEETIGFCHIFIIGGILIAAPCPPPPPPPHPGYAYGCQCVVDFFF